MRYLTGLILSFFVFQNAIGKESSLSSTYLGSREGDPSSIVENVSTIHGDYTEIEVDLTVPAPDSLTLSRFYSSRDSLKIASFGGWRFNPHCYLSVQKDPKGKSYTSAEGKFERTFVYIGNSEGSILTYLGWQNANDTSKKTVFKIDPEEESVGIANTAKGSISSWTNLKNNELYFDPATDSFELLLCSKGKRFYKKHLSRDIYVITHEILPSGSKIFYEFDEEGQLTFIRETNASEEKVLAWIRIQYGDEVHIETSDGKTADYGFDQDSSEARVLTHVTRSHKPPLYYQYKVIDNQALLTKKILPEGRCVQLEYFTDKANNHKVKSVTIPMNENETSKLQFSYGDLFTQIDGPEDRKSIYRFDEDFQLTRIEQYLDGSQYRTYKKDWGIRSDAGNLIAASLEDHNGDVYHYKYFVYDNKENIVEEREYGDIIGTGHVPLIIDEDGYVTNQDGHIKKYSYFSGKNTEGYFQADSKGSGVKYWYKKGTNLLLKKFILTKESPDSEKESDLSGIKNRHFYLYNEDAALTTLIIDDGKEGDLNDDYGVSQRKLTYIFPKQELPNLGAPEIVEQKYRSKNKKSETLIEKSINRFDTYGNIISEEIFDANEEHLYTLFKSYSDGLLVSETDPLGGETHYYYDSNRNLISQIHSDSGISLGYTYDLRNNLISTLEKNKEGETHETKISYDTAGNVIEEIDQLGRETHYINDALGRSIQVAYPEERGGYGSSIEPTYSLQYDLFDNPISITDPKGRVVSKTFNVKGKPTQIIHPDGSKEVFLYDSGGNLHRYCGRDGLLQAISYDYIGRVTKVEYFKRGESKDSYREKSYNYNAFNKISETDKNGYKTTYIYDDVGRLATIKKGEQKIELLYDSLGRKHGVKKWKTDRTFSLEIKEYDLLDRVIEERIENETGKTLFKKRYLYNESGQLKRVICYPQNKESILFTYEYDGFGRLIKTEDAMHQVTTISYDDAYINEWGQKTQKRIIVDPLGNQTEEVFDRKGNIVKTQQKDKFGQLLSESKSLYDPVGNKMFERAHVITEGERSGVYDTHWSFDNVDQLDSIVQGEGSSELTNRYEYNPYGELVAKFTQNSNDPITYFYNKYGNLESSIYKKDRVYKFNYDPNDNITEIILNSSSKIKYSFDENHLLLSEKIQDEFGSYQVNRTYDGEGKIKTLHLPDGSYVEYIYEGPFVKNATRFNKDKKEFYHYQVISRDQMGNILEEILPGNAGERKQLWDEAGRRIEIMTEFFQDKVLQYDCLNNIKNRETVLDDEKYLSEYDFNALCQLISERGEIEHTYAYDSIGNRVQHNHSSYQINAANQLIEAEGRCYFYDQNGNLTAKKVGDKTWAYESNPLNQLILIKTPDEDEVSFTYAPNGKRLIKKTESKGKKPKILRYFYLGDTEIGSMDENGAIIDLKIPSDPNNPEAPSIAFEIKKEPYVPLYDLQGNIVCLLDHQRHRIVESYRYSVYGEEEILNHRGKQTPDSSAGNPWRCHGKRVDKELGLIYFGYRYYDPEIGRWITPDPLGPVDGANLYAYARNNPLKYVDFFGLSSEIDPSCGCTKHDHPGWHNAPEGCVCICGKDGSYYRGKSGSTIKSRLGGISHGVVDFAVGSLHDLQTAAVHMGSGDLEISFNERMQMLEAVELSQSNQMTAVEAWMMGMLSVDESDDVYQSFRSKTTLSLGVASLASGGYGVIRGVIGFTRLARMPMQVSRIGRELLKETSSINKGIKAKQIWTPTKRRTPIQNAFRHWKDHDHEFPELLNSKQYVEHAHNFFAGSRDQLLTKIRPNGEVLLYDIHSNTFGAFTSDGVPKTMFKPTEGIIYWETRN